MAVSGRRAVFLDRDGVLNRARVIEGRPYPPLGLDDFEITPDARIACDMLKGAGFHLVCVTNQPDVARGFTPLSLVESFHETLMRELPLDDVRVCTHDDGDDCDCRKPKPGLLTAAAADACIDITKSFMIGDRWRDVEAGRAAGCRTIFVDYHYAERAPEGADLTTGSVADGARWILGTAAKEGTT